VLLAAFDRVCESAAKSFVHRLELELRPLPDGLVAGSGEPMRGRRGGDPRGAAMEPFGHN
jgi:hypothetical protein